jgi:hypothetical protein
MLGGERSPALPALADVRGKPRFWSPRAVRGRFVFGYTTAPGEGAVSLEVVPMSTPANPCKPVVDEMHAAFLAFLPWIRLHGQVYFRHVKCLVTREDCIAEMVAIAWKWHVRLAQRGRDASRFVGALASYAARSVNSGRRLARMERPNDVLSGRAQREHGFAVVRLPAFSTLTANPLEEALHDNTQTEVPDQVAFRIDFPTWRLTRTERDRRVVDDLMMGEGTLDVSRKYGISPARVSQLRRDFHEDWLRFTADSRVDDTPILV